MTAFTDIDNLQDLKRAYRKLAARWHPDRGGNAATMQQINALYDQHRLYLRSPTCERPASATSTPNSKPGVEDDVGTDFSAIEIGYTVWVNGTECEVTAVTTDTFRVVAKGRNRQAVFDLASGLGKFNARLKASFDNRHTRRTQ
jgi:hypothetical protein